MQRRRTPVSCLRRNIISLPSHTDPYLWFNWLACLKVSVHYLGFRNWVALDTYRCHCVCACFWLPVVPTPQYPFWELGLWSTHQLTVPNQQMCAVGVVEWSVCMCAHHTLYWKAPGSACYRLWRIWVDVCIKGLFMLKCIWMWMSRIECVTVWVLNSAIQVMNMVPPTRFKWWSMILRVIEIPLPQDTKIYSRSCRLLYHYTNNYYTNTENYYNIYNNCH